MIDWTSDASHLLLNPRMPADERRRLESLAIDLPGHVWLGTSGTTGTLKLTALSKAALLASAAAVNRHLASDAGDVWYCVLPAFHVGGLGIHARAFLSGARVIVDVWDPRRLSEAREATLTALVPAQVSDLVAGGLRPPPRLRAVVVGGGPLRDELYAAGRALGWPLLPSYGMTETCSQVATARPESPELVLLDHVEARADAAGRLEFRGPSLLTGYASEAGFVDPKLAGWFRTEDLGAVEGRSLRVQGRSGDFVKIGGESVDLTRLDAIVSSVTGGHAALLAVPDSRLGHVIHLVVDDTVEPDEVRGKLEHLLHPFERPRQVHRVAEIPRTALGKLMRRRLLDLLPESVE